MISPEEVAVRRRKLGFTQTKLAKESGISQSLIAKLERGLINPSYATVQALDATLSQASNSGLTAKSFVKRQPIDCKPGDKISTVIELMSKHHFSQIPVVFGGNIVGLITEQEIFTGLREGKKYVKGVMRSPPPLVAEEASEALIYALLEHTPIILVQDKGKLIGVITKADVFRVLKN